MLYSYLLGKKLTKSQINTLKKYIEESKPEGGRKIVKLVNDGEEIIQMLPVYQTALYIKPAQEKVRSVTFINWRSILIYFLFLLRKSSLYDYAVL